MKSLIAVLVAASLQPGPRAPLTPAETLLEPAILRAINEEPTSATPVTAIAGTDAAAGEIALGCAVESCGVATQAAQKLSSLIAAKKIPQPARTIRIVNAIDPAAASRFTGAIHVSQAQGRSFRVVRGLWSAPGVGDEIVEIFARHGDFTVEVRGFEEAGQLPWEAFGVPQTTIVASDATSSQHGAFVAAASAYFLATMPNAGSEALLSHLTVGAHARLAEDGRRAVAQMGSQQRASADVLIMFGQAIEREQRRMRSFERFVPEPVDPVLHGRILEMEKGITSIWTSMGITSSPFVPAAERIRGRGGEDRRVPARAGAARITPVEPPTALLKFPNPGVILFELSNLIDGRRSISDIRDVLSAEFGAIALPVLVDYFDRLAATGAITIK